MDDQKKQIIDKLKQANNILVTVKSDPSIDQLAACIGLTLILNELGKHATAVFSGSVPSVLEFLHPEKTLESNTDSLRDFIIALDKSKADKLRYKVEDKVVKIFITPYKTSISDADLEFSQGDFNVDVVVALGVHIQDELDQAIIEHGKILHDATVMSITTEDGEKLGTVNWLGKDVSSLSEMVTSIADQLGKKDVLDNQIATALLTGIVAETERFSNNKTTPQTMSASAKLLTAGANQELVASKLAEPEPEPAPEPEKPEQSDEGDGESSEGSEDVEPKEPPKSSDGTLSIDHTEDELPTMETPAPESTPVPESPHEAEPNDQPESELHETKSIELPRAEAPTEPPSGLPADEQAALDLLKNRQIQVDEHGALQPIETEHRDFLGDNERPLLDTTPVSPDSEENPAGAPFDLSKFALTPPVMGGTLTANSRPEGLDPSTDPLTTGKTKPQILSHDRPGAAQKEKEAKESTTEHNATEKKMAEKPEAPPEPAPKPAEPAVERPAPVAAPAETPGEAPVKSAEEAPKAPETLPAPDVQPAAAPEPLIAPAFPMAPSAPATPASKPESAAAPKTLEDLEKELHSPHVAVSEPVSPELAPSASAAAPTASMPSVPPTGTGAFPAMPPVSPADLATSASEAHPALQAALQDKQPTPAEPVAPEAVPSDAPIIQGGKLQAQPLTAAEMAPPAPAPEPAPSADAPKQNPADAPQLEAQTMTMPLPPTLNVPPPSATSSTGSPAPSPTAPPPVPPPLTPNFLQKP